MKEKCYKNINSIITLLFFTIRKIVGVEIVDNDFFGNKNGNS